MEGLHSLVAHVRSARAKDCTGPSSMASFVVIVPGQAQVCWVGGRSCGQDLC